MLEREKIWTRKKGLNSCLRLVSWFDIGYRQNLYSDWSRGNVLVRSFPGHMRSQHIISHSLCISTKASLHVSKVSVCYSSPYFWDRVQVLSLLLYQRTEMFPRTHFFNVWLIEIFQRQTGSNQTFSVPSHWLIFIQICQSSGEVRTAPVRKTFYTTDLAKRHTSV